MPSCALKAVKRSVGARDLLLDNSVWMRGDLDAFTELDEGLEHR